MEELGYTWRYSNMSRVLMREDRNADLQSEGTLGFSAEQRLPGSDVAAQEGSFISRSQRSEGISKEVQTLQREVAPTPHTTHTSLLRLEDIAECETEAFYYTGPYSHAPGPEPLEGCLDSRVM